MRENIFSFEHLFLCILCLFKHFDVIYESVVHAIKQNLDNLCDHFWGSLRISYQISTRARSPNKINSFCMKCVFNCPANHEQS